MTKTKFDATLHTNGSGYWSTIRRDIRTTSIDLAYVDDDDKFGELRVYFDPEDWNVEDDGLIYTDNLFIKELKFALHTKGFNADDVDFSEQGMQGDAYVSFDVGPKFIGSYYDIILNTLDD